jgi:hypothetical protein
MNTYIDQAQTRVQTEQEAIEAKLDALDSFTDRVANLPTESVPSSSGITARNDPRGVHRHHRGRARADDGGVVHAATQADDHGRG